MKRLILRVAALALVVVLGLIAIAQAQRGMDEPATTDTPAAAGSRDAAPRLMAAPTDANPLRRESAGTFASEPPAPTRVRPAGHETESPTLAAPRTEGAPPQQTADPFGLQSTRPAPSGAADGQVNLASADPQQLAATLEPPAEPAGAAKAAPLRLPDRDPPSSADLNPASSAPAPSLAPGRSTDVGDRYATLPSVAAGRRAFAEEPRPLKADPFAAPAQTAPAARPPETPSNSPLAPRADAAPPLDAAPANEGTGQPGGKQLEGPQTPQVTIEKTGPREIQVGKPATFKVTVRNTGQIPATGIEIRDQVPKGTRLLGTVPKASRGARGELVWTLGTLKPGEDTSVEIELMPLNEGEVGSVATVHINAEASARSTVTKPELVVQVSAPNQVLIGEELTMTITVSNTGTGVATGVVLEEHVPAGFQHSAGSTLEYEVGQLAPGASKQMELALTASKPGTVANLLKVRGDGSLKTEHRLNLEVIAPQLELALEGPRRRYLEREATYAFSVSNPGTAAAKQVELVAYLPPALKFVSANNAGQYVEADRTVHWRLEELPARESGAVQLVTVPIEAGQQKIRLRSVAERGLEVEKEMPVVVEGIAAILFQAADINDPIEVGGETTYEIRVVNQGSKAATNVRLMVMLPPELKAVAAEGPTRYAVEGNQVVFEGLARLAPKADTTYQVRVQGLRAGDLRTRIQLMTDEMQSPVNKEESTRVYADE